MENGSSVTTTSEVPTSALKLNEALNDVLKELTAAQGANKPMHSLHEGLSIRDAALLGNATAAHCIQAPGASTGIVSLDRIRQFQKTTPLKK